jgi:hypothetical protein
MAGRQPEALEALREVDDRIPSLMISFTSSLRLLLEGQVSESVEAMAPLRGIGDPEARYYVGRHLAHAGDVEGAMAALEWSIDNGFFCFPALVRDPWLDPLRPLPAFARLLHRAEGRHRDAVIAFLTAEGNRILGIDQPV